MAHDTTKRYHRNADKYDPDNMTRFLWYGFSVEKMSKWWEGLLNLIPHGVSVLEAGCGAGHLAAMIHERRLDLTYRGFDLVPQNVKDAKKRVPKADLYVGNYWEELQTPGEFVISCGTLFTTTEKKHTGRLFDLIDANFSRGFACIALTFKTSGIPMTVLGPRFDAMLERSVGVERSYYRGKRDWLRPSLLRHNKPFYVWRESAGDITAPDVPTGLYQEEDEYEGGLFE